jgi:hypothetical protein
LLERVIKENPYSGWIWMNLGSIYKTEGKSKQLILQSTKRSRSAEKTIHPGYSAGQWRTLSNAFKAKSDLERAAIIIDIAATSIQAQIEMDLRNNSKTHISDLGSAAESAISPFGSIGSVVWNALFLNCTVNPASRIKGILIMNCYPFQASNTFVCGNADGTFKVHNPKVSSPVPKSPNRL